VWQLILKIEIPKKEVKGRMSLKNSAKHLVSKRGRYLLSRIYPWTGLNGLDRKVLEYIDFKGGVFFEAGANDGIRQSNTFYLEKKMGWKGILVEPIPELARECKRNRKASDVYQVALTTEENSGGFITLMDVDLMSSVVQAENLEAQLALAEEVQGITRKEYQVATKSLSQIIDQSPYDAIDFMSIDVEGYELDVLAGLNLERHCPQWLLVETSKIEEVEKLLLAHMTTISQLSHHDYLFRKIDKAVAN
jgi:FkbM family methyltransferase